MECFRLLLEHLAWIEHQFLCGIRDSRKAGSLWEMMRGVAGVRKSIDQSCLAKGLVLLCWGFKGRDSVRRGQHSSNRVSGISTRTMHKFTTPSLSQNIKLRLASRQFLGLPLVQTLLPVTFVYSLSSEAVVMRQLRWWKRLLRSSLTRSHKCTSMRPSRSCWNDRTSALQPEEITSKGTMCVLSIKVTIQKKCRNLFNETRIFFYLPFCVPCVLLLPASLTAIPESSL